jgi:hypothetical protein
MANKTITISGKQFSVPSPFEAGHVLTAGQATSLNQTYHENIRNNLAADVKAGKIDQAGVLEYAKKYVNEMGAGGGNRSGDPVGSRARDMAAKDAGKAYKSAGGKIKDMPEANVERQLAANLVHYHRQAFVSVAAERSVDVTTPEFAAQLKEYVAAVERAAKPKKEKAA